MEERLVSMLNSSDREMRRLAQRICSKQRISYWVLARRTSIRLSGSRCRYIISDNPTYMVGSQSPIYTPENQNSIWKIYKIDLSRKKE